MSERGYSIKDQQAIHFITFAVVQWIDIFTRKIYADIVVDSLKFCQKNKGLRVHAWCIMSNHIHLIISAEQGKILSDILRDLKKYTSFKVLQTIAENTTESRKNWIIWILKKAGEKNSRNKIFQLWQQDNHPVECSSNAIIDSRMAYLHENPVRAGLVRNEWEYVYSSGIDYYMDGKGLIDIDFI